MKIKDAVIRLQEVMNHSGPETEIFFDCPHCGISFKPGKVVIEMIHWKPEEKK